ncbi:MAG: GNAT family N-acetyltransferase [Gammaproteobacteria bacterium]
MGALSAPKPLGDSHDLADFDCGEPALNEWLRRRARHNETHGASRTFVVCDGPHRVVGFYCLATGAVAREDSPGRIRRNMPEPIPVMVLGRLAVDLKYRRCGLGRGLLKDALLRTLSVSAEVGVRALLVHAISEDARIFYKHWGFRQSPTDGMTLMLALNEAAAIMRGSS